MVSESFPHSYFISLTSGEHISSTLHQSSMGARWLGASYIAALSVRIMSSTNQAPVPLNIELTKFDRIQILLEIHIAVLSRIVGLS